MDKAAVSESKEKLSDKIGQFAAIPYSFIKQPEGLSIHSRWLFVILRYFTNGQSGTAFPSYDKIHELTGMQRGTIAKCIRQLEDEGWLKKRRRFGNSNVYTLIIPAPGHNEKVRSEDESDYLEDDDSELWDAADPPF